MVKLRLQFLFLAIVGMSTSALAKERIVKIQGVERFEGFLRFSYCANHERVLEGSGHSLNDVPTFYVYTTGEIDHKLSSLTNSVRNDYSQQVAGFREVRAGLSQLGSHVKSDYEEHKKNYQSLEDRLESLDAKYETSIENLPSLLSSEVFPNLEQKLEKSEPLIESISSEVMSRLFEQLESINNRLQELEKKVG